MPCRLRPSVGCGKKLRGSWNAQSFIADASTAKPLASLLRRFVAVARHSVLPRPQPENRHRTGPCFGLLTGPIGWGKGAAVPGIVGLLQQLRIKRLAATGHGPIFGAIQHADYLESFALMLSDRAFVATTLTAVAVIGLVAAPAVHAMATSAQARAASLSALVGRFTPASGDPVLLQRYARLSDEARRNFRFTPALPRTENRAVTLVVRARASGATPAGGAENALRPVQPVAITPVSYRLGSAVGYTAFAATVTGGPQVDIAALPQARRPSDGTARRPSRFGADMRIDSRTLPGTAERVLDPDRAYSVDLTGSYRLSRNVDVTAGVRLQRENDRLAPLTDQRQDSQAVYVGTQFRF